MLAGHFSTALIANKYSSKNTLLFFLIISQLQDFLWFTFHYLGLEPTEPADLFSTTLVDMSVNMLYSHDLLPLSIWALLAFVIGKILFKSNKIGLIAASLILIHFVLDFFSGHPHHLFGEESHSVGLGLYRSNVYLAIGIEAVFSAVTLWYFFRLEAKKGIQRTVKNRAYIIGLFVFGIVFLLFVATVSLREWFGIPEFDLSFNTSVPTLVATYVGMLIYLNHFAATPSSK